MLNRSLLIVVNVDFKIKGKMGVANCCSAQGQTKEYDLEPQVVAEDQIQEQEPAADEVISEVVKEQLVSPPAEKEQSPVKAA